MPSDFSIDFNPGESDLLPCNRFEQTPGCWAICRLIRLAFVQSQQRFPCRGQSLSDLSFYQGQQPQSKCQQPSDTKDLIVLSYIQRTDTQRTRFEKVEVSLNGPCPSQTDDGLTKRSLLRWQVGCLNAKAQTVPLLRNE